VSPEPAAWLGTPADDSQFNTDVLAALTAAVPSSIDLSHRTAIMARLKFANEFLYEGGFATCSRRIRTHSQSSD
jgi:hypothetical protein